MSSSTRTYSSDRRRRQAEQTRADVLDAAVKLFSASGWAGTTLAAIAAEAGVAVETVYSGFGSKKNLLRQALDVSIVGDTLPVPLADRPEYLRMGDGTRAQRARAGARLHRETTERVARLWQTAREAAAADPEVAGWCREMEQTRREQLADGLQLMLGERVDGRQLDLIWGLLSPEVYLKLTDERGWTARVYEQWIARAVFALCGELPPPE
jgi:AcrR family transcriptional regulator